MTGNPTLGGVTLSAATAIMTIAPLAPAHTASAPHVVTVDLDSAPVPGGMCRHPKGHLVDGERDLGMNGNEWIERVARGRAGGRTVAVASIGCTAGGVSWPSTLVFYGRSARGDARLLADLYLGRFRASEHANVRSMWIKNGVLNVHWVTYNGCCFEKQKYSARMQLRGKKVTVWNLTSGRVTHPY